MAAVKRRRTGAGWVTYGLLAVIILISLAPFYWQVVIASNTQSAIGQSPPAMLPGSHLWQHIRIVFENADFGKALLNSLIVCSIITVSVVLTSTLAGFAFAKLRFKGRGALLIFVVATMTIPTQLGIIPLYIMMAQWFGWNDHLAAVIVPALVNAFGVFFMRQYLVGAFPAELLDAGRVDGASTLRIWWNLVLPVARPAAAVLGLLTFMTAWNDFFYPIVVLTPQNPTVQVALNELASGYQTDYSTVFTGAFLATFPILVVFVVLGRQIIGGIMQGAVKA
jgi:cellobiose transport system permease protein